MNNTDTQIVKMANWLSRFSLAVMIFSVIGYAYVWTNTKLAHRIVSQNSFPDLPDTLNLQQNLMLFIVGAIPTLLFAIVLFQAKQFFDSYRSGLLFPTEGAAKLKSIGKFCLALAIVNPLIRTITLLIMTWLNPLGQKILILSLSSTDGFLLVLSGLLFMIGYILSEANRIAEDNERII